MSKIVRTWLVPLALLGMTGALAGCVAYPAYPTYGYAYGPRYAYTSGPYYYGGYGGGWHHGWHRW
ncbi:MAG: hypothetical protein BGO51_14200 [Rhodospirillales bacterium 69-11]|jgi:hypothetical protein|nr:hypothetical protein [Rhodospirillales bacterium]OJW26551.1 MAG: hypothetical protein BGO51_14200 [Rhodospirillales bacterium 69-11]